MGAWGVESFANDDAMDWAGELERVGLPAVPRTRSPRSSSWRTTSSKRRSAPRRWPRRRSSRPCEGGRPRCFRRRVASWIPHHPGAPDPELTESARAAVSAILARSELQELWDESDDAQAWREWVTGLRARLE